MSKFQIVSPHEPAECLQAMDEMLAHDPMFLEEALVGCTVGDHTCYAVSDASTVEKARDRVPPFLRARTRVVEVEHRTPEQIRAYYDKAAWSWNEPKPPGSSQARVLEQRSRLSARGSWNEDDESDRGDIGLDRGEEHAQVSDRHAPRRRPMRPGP